MGKAWSHRINKANDNLSTPYSMTKQLLENERFDYNKKFLDPACGKYAIVKVLPVDYIDAYDIEFDFFNETDKYDYIITNPPWSEWDKFIEKAKEIAIEKFAMLGDADFLTGIGRYENKLYFDGEYNLSIIHEFVRKADLRHELRDDGKYPAGCIHFAWYIFENGYTGEPTFRWINNNPYILRKDTFYNREKYKRRIK